MVVITRIFARNIGPLESIDLDLGRRNAVLLVGKNGVGKTTLGSVIEIVQLVARGWSRVKQLYDKFPSLEHTMSPFSLEIEVLLNETTFVYRLDLEVPEGFKEHRIANEALLVNGAFALKRERSQVSYVPQGSEEGPRFFLDWHIFALTVVQARMEGDPVVQFRDWFSRVFVLSPIPELMESVSLQNDILLSRHCENIADFFSALFSEKPSAYEPFVNSLREFWPDVQDVTNPAYKGGKRIIVTFEHETKSITVPFDHLSSGEKCQFLASLLVAAQAAQGPLTVFWDEPDAHLALDEVQQFILRLIKASRKLHGQLIATSHHPETVRVFSKEDAVVLFRNTHLQGTRYRFANDLNLDAELVETLQFGEFEL